jgi:hypothetical protein
MYKPAPENVNHMVPSVIGLSIVTIMHAICPCNARVIVIGMLILATQFVLSGGLICRLSVI